MSSVTDINKALTELYYPPLTDFLDSNIEDYMQKGPPVPPEWYYERGLKYPPWLNFHRPWYKRILRRWW